MKLKLRIWRQKSGASKGQFAEYDLDDVSPDESFLEMIDMLNDRLTLQGEEPIAFDHDCREGICGMCSMVINGIAHGPKAAITTCQLAHAHVQGRRHDHGGAVACGGVSCREGPGCGPDRA